MPLNFSIEIDAPAGLLGIAEHLAGCKMNLEPWGLMARSYLKVLLTLNMNGQ